MNRLNQARSNVASVSTQSYDFSLITRRSWHPTHSRTIRWWRQQDSTTETQWHVLELSARLRYTNEIHENESFSLVGDNVLVSHIDIELHQIKLQLINHIYSRKMYEKKGRPLREISDEVGFHFRIRSWYPKTDWQRGRFPEKEYARTEFVDEIVLVSTCLRAHRYLSYRSSRQWDRRPIRNRRYDRRYSIFAWMHRSTDWYWIFSTSIDLRSTLDLISWKWPTTSR